MIYSEMTDLEINKAVASACLDEWYDNGICVVRCDDEDRNIFNPCSSWADAGPIIQKYGISLHYIGVGHERGGWGADDPSGEKYTYNDNPLRAAMIVFLMMQEKPDAA